MAAAIFASAFFIRGAWLVHDNPRILESTVLVFDEQEYDALARQIFAGRGYIQSTPRQGLREVRPGAPTAFRTPGFPIILGAIYWTTGTDRVLARLVLLLLASSISPIVYGLCLVLFGRQSLAILAALGCVFSATGVRVSGWLYGEETASLLLILALTAVVIAQRRESQGFAWLGGVLLGFAILTRGFLLLVPFAPAAWLVVRSRRLLAALVLVAAAVLPAGWILRNCVAMGVCTLSTETPEVLWLGNNSWARGSWPGDWAPQHEFLLDRHPEFDRLDEVGRAGIFWHEVLEEIVQHPGRVLWLLPRKAIIFFSPVSWMGRDWTLAFALPLSLTGLLTLWFQRKSRHLLLILALPIAGVLLVCLMAYSDVRHRHPIDPLIFVLAAIGMTETIVRLLQWSRRYFNGGDTSSRHGG